MKIAFVANVRMPTEKAHGIQIVKTCEALADVGHDVILLVPKRKTGITENPFSYYGAKKNFVIEALPAWDTVSFGMVGFILETLSFAFSVRKYLHRASVDVVYGRDELVLACLPHGYVWESHTGAWGWVARMVAGKARKMVTITQGLKDFYVERGIAEDRIVVAHDGVDVAQFENKETKAVSRKRLLLPPKARIAMYVGRLDGWKGTETFLEASRKIPDTLFVVIGGEEKQIRELSPRYPYVRFLGPRPYKELKDNMASADVLVLPNTGMDEVSVRFTSPLKLFAYMASGIPITASDLPSIREVLDDTSAYLVPADDAGALAEGITSALSDKGVRAKEALNRVRTYSWAERARSILTVL